MTGRPMRPQARRSSDPYNGPTWTEKLIALAVLAILAFITVAVLWWIFVAVLLVASR